MESYARGPKGSVVRQTIGDWKQRIDLPTASLSSAATRTSGSPGQNTPMRHSASRPVCARSDFVPAIAPEYGPRTVPNGRFFNSAARWRALFW